MTRLIGIGLALALALAPAFAQVPDQSVTLSPQEYQQVLAALAAKDPIMGFLMKKQSEAQEKAGHPGSGQATNKELSK